MFKKAEKDVGVNRQFNCIDAGTEVLGDFVFRGVLQIAGRVKGNIVAVADGEAHLLVASQGFIEGEVRAPRVTLHGRVVGDVFATDHVQLHPNAQVYGTIYYKTIEVAQGAEIYGKLEHLGTP